MLTKMIETLKKNPRTIVYTCLLYTSGNLVGTIDMYDKYTFVEVPREVASDVLEAMKNVKIKGKSVNVEPANRK